MMLYLSDRKQLEQIAREISYATYPRLKPPVRGILLCKSPPFNDPSDPRTTRARHPHPPRISKRHLLRSAHRERERDILLSAAGVRNLFELLKVALIIGCCDYHIFCQIDNCNSFNIQLLIIHWRKMFTYCDKLLIVTLTISQQCQDIRWSLYCEYRGQSLGM